MGLLKQLTALGCAALRHPRYVFWIDLDTGQKRWACWCGRTLPPE